MTQAKPIPPREHLAVRLRQAFLDYGYEQLTMIGLAKACGFSRRALYHYFSSKEEAFRFHLRYGNEVSIEAGLAAGRQAIEAGSDVIEVFTQLMDTRYGENRRLLSRSPHALEINDQAFRRARDIMIDAAVDFQAKLSVLIADMQADGLLQLKPGTTPDDLAQSLCDGARGSNQALPPISPEDLPIRYRKIISAILLGTAELPSEGRQRKPAAKAGAAS